MIFQNTYDFFLTYLTKENVTFAMSLVSFILTTGQLIFNIYTRRTNFSISVERFEIYEHHEYTRHIFTFMLQNRSSNPIAITRMELCDVKCLIQHQWIGERYYPKFPESDIPITERILSTEFPINLIGHEGKLVKIIFDFYDNTHPIESPTTIKVTTNKKTKYFSLELPAKSNNKLYF